MIAMVNERLTVDGLPPAITTDIICGFPTETDEDFKHTLKIASEVRYLHMHVFPYSVRTGTAAARWKQLSPKPVQSRVQQLLSLDEELSLSYRKLLVGKQVQVIIENDDSQKDHFRGRCEHYAEITLKTNAKQGELVNATVSKVTNEHTFARQEITILSNHK